MFNIYCNLTIFSRKISLHFSFNPCLNIFYFITLTLTLTLIDFNLSCCNWISNFYNTLICIIIILIIWLTNKKFIIHCINIIFTIIKFCNITIRFLIFWYYFIIFLIIFYSRLIKYNILWYTCNNLTWFFLWTISFFHF